MTSIDREKLSAAVDALGIEKSSGIGSALKRLVSKAKPIAAGALGVGGLYTLDKSLPGGLMGDQQAEPEQEAAEQSPFTAAERTQFARHGMDPDRLRFMSSLSKLRQGMNLEKKLFADAMSGQLPAQVLGGGDDREEDLEAYA